MQRLNPTIRKNDRERFHSPARGKETPSRWRQFLGWSVHGYTALGLIAAALLAVLLVHGGPASFRWCFWLMTAATIVDMTDGTLARLVQIQKAVPGFDGRRLDDIIDYLNYSFLPILLIWRAELMPAGQEGWLILALVASIYGFCQVQAKTDDGYFLGFPSLWNVVALYLYVLPIPAWGCLAIVVILSVFTFVPSKYPYPSQPGWLNQIAAVLGLVWALPLGWLLLSLPESTSPRTDPELQRFAVISLFYPVFYLGASWFVTWQQWRRSNQSR